MTIKQHVELAFQRIRDEQPDLVLLDIGPLNPGRVGRH